MVLATSSSQYKLLQALANAYIAILDSFAIANCLANPNMFNNCTDPSNYAYSQHPGLPTANELSTYSDTYFYGYSSVDFYGWSSKNFSTVTPKLVNLTTGLLVSACGTSVPCSKQWNKTKNGVDVARALAKTNVNTMQSLLNDNPDKIWIPKPAAFSLYSRSFTAYPDPSQEIYGIHDALFRATAGGRLNATRILQRRQLGEMLQGGASMYEKLLHQAAIGSYSSFDRIQANINLTGTQVFTHYGYNDVDFIQRPGRVQQVVKDGRSRKYKSKWEVWQAQANGTIITDVDKVLAQLNPKTMGTMSTDVTSALGPLGEFASAATCPGQGNIQSGITFLDKVDQVCAVEGSVSNALSIYQGVSSVFTAATPKEIANVAHNMADILAGSIVSMCVAGYNGFPCYSSPTAWQVGDGLKNVLELAIELNKLESPVGIAIVSADVFCGAAGLASQLYKESLACCAKSCASGACSAGIVGCSRGGLC